MPERSYRGYGELQNGQKKSAGYGGAIFFFTYRKISRRNRGDMPEGATGAKSESLGGQTLRITVLTVCGNRNQTIPKR